MPSCFQTSILTCMLNTLCHVMVPCMSHEQVQDEISSTKVYFLAILVTCNRTVKHKNAKYRENANVA